MIDPTSIASHGERRAQSSLPSKTRSEATVSYHPPDLSPVSEGSSEDDTDDELDGELTMSPADIRTIRRLMARVNVLPVIARADSLTNEKLVAIREAIRRDLRAADVDFGVFGPIAPPAEDTLASNASKMMINGNGIDTSHNNTANGSVNGNGNGNGHTNGDSHQDHSDSEEPVEERKSRSVIKLRPSRLSAKLSRSKSRSRIDLTEAAASEPSAVDLTDTESVASVRFSAHIVMKNDITDILPFAIITPENVPRRAFRDSPDVAANRRSLHTRPSVSSMAPSEDGVGSALTDSAPGSPLSPSATSNRNLAYLSGPPADLRGIFVRKFRWGTIDVLSPEHCDFAALRTAVFSTHMKVGCFGDGECLSVLMVQI